MVHIDIIDALLYVIMNTSSYYLHRKQLTIVQLFREWICDLKLKQNKNEKH